MKWWEPGVGYSILYISKKPTKFGIKVWVLSEAKTSYVLGLQIYTGASDGNKEKIWARE